MFDDIKTKIFNNKEYIWALIGKFLPQLLFFITTMILSRVLTPNDFGVVGVLSVFIYFASVLMDSGLGGSLIKEKQIESIDCSTIFTFNLFTSCFIYCLMFVTAPYLERFFGIDGLCSVTRVLSLVFVINAFGLVPNSLLVKQLRFKEISFSLIIATIIASIASIVLAFYTKSVFSIVVYQLSQSFSLVLMYRYHCRMPLSIKFSFVSFKKLLPFGLSTTISSGLDTIYENILNIILGKFAGATVVGYFSLAKRVEEVPSKSIVQTISNTSFPILVKFVGDTKKMNQESMRIIRYSALLLIPIFGIFICFAKSIIILLFGDQWVDASTFLQLLSFAGIFLFVDTMYRGFIKSANQPQLLLTSSFFKRIVGIIFLLIAAFLYSDYIVYAYILSSAIAAIISIKYYANIIKVPFINYLWKLCQVLIIPLVPLCAIIVCGTLLQSLYIKMIISLIVLGLYYVIVIKSKIRY